MATKAPRRPGRRPHEIHKPNGSVHPRVQKVGPEHFGIVAVDCAKARSKWMFADSYGNVLIGPTELDHAKPAFQGAADQVRQACVTHQVLDLIVVVERTGRYHHVVREGAIAPMPWIMRLFWGISSRNPPEFALREASSIAGTIDALPTTLRSNG